MQIIQSGEVFDVVVVGSGATGGWMAKQLSEAGMKVALLEGEAEGITTEAVVRTVLDSVAPPAVE